MSTDHISPIGGAGKTDRSSTEPSKTDSLEFRRLLEQLEKLSTKSEEKVVKDAEGLQDAIRKADDDFISAMDLRRKLEEAFRRSQQ